MDNNFWANLWATLPMKWKFWPIWLLVLTAVGVELFCFVKDILRTRRKSKKEKKVSSKTVS